MIPHASAVASKAGMKLLVKGKGGDGVVEVGSMDLVGSAISVSGKTMDFTGPIDVDGSMATFSVHDLVGATIDIHGNASTPPQALALQFHHAIDTTLDSDFGITKITADRFDNSGPTTGIRADWLGALSIRHDVTMALDLIDPEPGRAVLGRIQSPSSRS